jgi:hypothetical protein
MNNELYPPNNTEQLAEPSNHQMASKVGAKILEYYNESKNFFHELGQAMGNDTVDGVKANTPSDQK